MNIQNRNFIVFAAISDNLVPNQFYLKFLLKTADYWDSSGLAVHCHNIIL